MKRPALIILPSILVLFGLLNCFWFLFYNIETDRPWLMTAMSLLAPYHFNYLFEDYHLKWGDYAYSFNLLNLYFYISFLIGVLAYALSKGGELRLIRFNYFLVLLSFLLRIPFILARLFVSNESRTALTPEEPNAMIYLLYLPGLILLFVAYSILGSLKKEAPPELTVERGIDGQQTE